MNRSHSESGVARGATRLALLALLTASHGCSLPVSIFPPDLPESRPILRYEVPYQGWSDEESQWFHHISQGTATPNIPYEWFVALEQPKLSLFVQPLFRAPDYLARFGFLRSPASPENPDGLPVGFARQDGVYDSRQKVTFNGIGFTCAACHTGQLEYRGTAIRIEGGPATTDLGKFRHALALALGYTKYVPFRFSRFADRVLGANHSREARDALAADLDAALERGLANPELKAEILEASSEEGFMRLDAIGRIGNFVFGVGMQDDNVRPLNAPVAYPHIWSTPWFDWVQYNGSIRQPMVRNAGEALGVFAYADFDSASETFFRSSVQVHNLFALEQLLAGPRAFEGLRSPRWPEHVLGAIDREKAAKGAGLYREICQNCHLPPVGSPDLAKDRYWEPENSARERYLKLRMVALEVVGTDPNQAISMIERKVDASKAGIAHKDFGPALGAVVEKVVGRWHDDQVPPTPDDVRTRMNGHRDNIVRAERAYKARPLDGIWATPPYLHNGSVPNLYLLLGPASERPRSFYLGSREFDPVHVGYEHTRVSGGFELEVPDNCSAPTSRNGSCNSGHEFRDGPTGNGVVGRALSEEERWELIEYLKTL